MSKRNQVGFTLLEVLIAIVISAIGLLGIAKLQLITLKNNSASQYRSIAIQLASDAIERMRANQNGVNNRLYDMPISLISDSKYASPVATCRDASGLCTPQQRVDTDAADMMAQARRTLPNGAIIVCIDSGTLSDPTFNGKNIDPQCDGLGTAYAIKVFWLDDRNNQSTGLGMGNYTSFVTRATP
jgi:type IV pilus assembly protein PilV